MPKVVYNFIPQSNKNSCKKEKPWISCVGYLAIDHDTACFLVGKGNDQKIVARLARPIIDYIGPFGITIKGFEVDGVNKFGEPKFFYREWYCTYNRIEE